jgi:transposase
MLLLFPEVEMATMRVTVAVQTQILELHRQGRSERAIARIMKRNRRTVSRIIKRGTAVIPGAVTADWSVQIDWKKIKLEVSRGVQINILAREHAGDRISYVQFWREYNKRFPDHPTVTMKLVHNPGEKSFFDYSEGINIINRSTGEITKTSLMCGVMAMSSKCYGEFTLTQKRDDLIRSMENAFRFFGGVTPYVTLDNQKAAVDKSHWYDPDVNPEFTDFANHWGFAVIPARPVRPRDKASNESNIGVIQRQFYQEVRDRNFYSLAELNEVFREYLKKLNANIMKDWGVSRNDRFEGEKHLLKPCPVNNWESCEWKTPKVHADCHVQVLKKFYSVPFKHVGQEMRVRITSKLIEIFDQDLNPIYAHVRLLGKETHSTVESHYPEHKLALTQYSVQVALREAERIGVETLKLVEDLLKSESPLRNLRRVQGILRLYQSGHASRAGLEHGCKMGMLFNKTQYGYIKSAAQYFDKNGNRLRLVGSAPIRETGSVYLHNQQQMEELKNDE